MDSTDNIILIGPMGCGKSTIGKQLARLTGKAFYDADDEIEKRTGAKISLIFEIEGEPGFRKRESDIIKELTAHHDIVLATGGGAILSEDNRRHLRKAGWVIYLDTDIDTLVKRTERDHNRPLLNQGNRRQKLLDVMQERESLYQQEADIIIKSTQKSVANIAKDILAIIEQKQK